MTDQDATRASAVGGPRLRAYSTAPSRRGGSPATSCPSSCRRS